jgi:nanoRNase/pAp phosphatase (c-di-AMP/oligoRNAs hydrolase)
MSAITELIKILKEEERVFIQTHNYPDHDAVASAFGLQQLFKEFGVEAPIIYKGDIQRDSLFKMIKSLNIDVYNYTDFDLRIEDKIIIVDGCKGNSNVNELTGEEIAVIDHHEVVKPLSVKYVDIRPAYGSCSTIIYSYYKELNVNISREVATALITGLNMDTALLTRGVSTMDVEAYSDLYVNANIALVNTILRNFIQTKDLNFYKLLLDKVIIKDRVAFCYFNDGCNQNLLGILGDFILALEEVEFVILCARNGDVVNFSIRSESEKYNAGTIIQEVLKDIGFGGGHTEMAGGVIKDLSKFHEKQIYKSFYKCIVGAR